MIDTSTLTIREMDSEDVAALAAAFADMGKTEEYFQRYWQENLEKKRVTLVAELAGKIVGYVNVIWESEYEGFRDQGVPEISDMNVIAPLRCQGIGTRMVSACEQLVRGKGKRAIGIGVGITSDYAIAQSLYPKLGYVPDGSGIHQDQWGGTTYSTKRLRETCIGEPGRSADPNR